jgi:hypothetical protein
MQTIKTAARRAGWLYLFLALTAPFSLIYVPSKLIVSGDATATEANIRGSELLFRLGVAGGLVGDVLFIFIALALYRLFAGVGRREALFMAALAIVSVPISFLDRLNQIAALVILGGPDFLKVFEPRQLDALAMLFLRLYGNGILIVEVFWGLWLIPFGILVWRSGFLPRALGVLLYIAGAGYALGSLATLTFPAYRHAIDQATMITNFGELPIVVYLAIWGARGPSANAPLPASS